MDAFLNSIDNIIWSRALIGLCLGVGLWFSIRTRFMQVRGFGEMLRLMVKGEKSAAGVSPWQALSISLSGRIGVGNIAGTATAIAVGGPGAIFWMWVMAFLGASTSYVECTLAQIYKEKLNNPQKAIAAHLEALNHKPTDHTLLHNLLDLFSETKQWKKAMEILMKLAELNTDKVKARYLVAAGNIANYELHSTDEAVELYNQALDHDPDDLKAMAERLRARL